MKLPEEEIRKRMEIKTVAIARFRVTLHRTKKIQIQTRQRNPEKLHGSKMEEETEKE